MKKKTNGFATKSGLKNLEKKMDLRFTQVDEKFKRVDDRFRWFRMEIKDDLEQFKKDAFGEFDSRWINRIDPILADIETHRERAVIWAEQNRRMEKKLDKFGERLDKVDGKMDKFGERLDKVDGRLKTVAKKVGA